MHLFRERSLDTLIAEFVEERKELEEAIEENLPRDKKARMQTERRLWFIAGLLDHDLNPTCLNKVVRCYERINAVPVGYSQPQLFSREQEPKDQRKRRDDIFNGKYKNRLHRVDDF